MKQEGAQSASQRAELVRSCKGASFIPYLGLRKFGFIEETAAQNLAPPGLDFPELVNNKHVYKLQYQQWTVTVRAQPAMPARREVFGNFPLDLRPDELS